MSSSAVPDFHVTFMQALRRGFALRCPRCGLGRLAQKVFGVRRECAYCGLDFFREPGYYVGAMIINYGITVSIIIAAYLLSGWVPWTWRVSTNSKILAWIGASIVVSLALVPLCRCLWLAVDYWVEPWGESTQAK